MKPTISSELAKQSMEEEKRYSSASTASKSEQETPVEVGEKFEETGNLAFMLYLFQGQNFF